MASASLWNLAWRIAEEVEELREQRHGYDREPCYGSSPTDKSRSNQQQGQTDENKLPETPRGEGEALEPGRVGVDGGRA